jgi:hypothetical protein
MLTTSNSSNTETGTSTLLQGHNSDNVRKNGHCHCHGHCPLATEELSLSKSRSRSRPIYHFNPRKMKACLDMALCTYLRVLVLLFQSTNGCVQLVIIRLNFEILHNILNTWSQVLKRTQLVHMYSRTRMYAYIYIYIYIYSLHTRRISALWKGDWSQLTQFRNSQKRWPHD